MERSIRGPSKGLASVFKSGKMDLATRENGETDERMEMEGSSIMMGSTMRENS